MDNNKGKLNPQETEDSEVKTYTEEEVQQLLQKESDRRVTEALKKAEKKQKAAIQEAEKLARMNEEERYKYELEQREKIIAEKERNIALMENRAEAGKALNQRGISIELVDLVVAEDADTMMQKIKILEQEFKKSVKAEVEKRLMGGSPKKNLETEGLKLEDFKKLPLGKQAELIKENPQLYKDFI